MTATVPKILQERGEAGVPSRCERDARARLIRPAAFSKLKGTLHPH
ncbi:hypothetical protein [Achromobacter spanius]